MASLTRQHATTRSATSDNAATASSVLACRVGRECASVRLEVSFKCENGKLAFFVLVGFDCFCKYFWNVFLIKERRAMFSDKNSILRCEKRVVQSNLDIVRLKEAEKNSHYIEVNFEGFLVKGPEIFRTKSRFDCTQ
jgi:hypothetical protein